MGESNPVPASGLWSGSGSKVNQFVHVPTSADTQHFIQIHTRVFSNLAHRQTDKPTRARGWNHIPPPLSEVNKYCTCKLFVIYYGCTRSFKIIDTGTNRQSVSEFLSVDNSNMVHTFYRFRDIVTKTPELCFTHPNVIWKPRSHWSPGNCRMRFGNDKRESWVTRRWKLHAPAFIISTTLTQKSKNRTFTYLMTLQEMTQQIYAWSVYGWNLQTLGHLFCCWQYGPIFIQFHTASLGKKPYWQIGTLCHKKSFKVCHKWGGQICPDPTLWYFIFFRLPRISRKSSDTDTV